MVGKEKEASLRKGRSGGIKDDASAAVKAKDRKPSASRIKDKSPARKAAKPEGVKSPGRGRPPKTPKPAESPQKKTPPSSPTKKANKSETAKRSASTGRRPIGRPKSPTRKPKETVQKRPQIIKIDDSDSELESDTPTTTTSSIQTRSRRTISKEPSIEILNNLRPRLPRLNIESLNMNLRSTYEPVKKLTEFSDEDEVAPPIKKTPKSKIQIGAIIAALIYCFGELLLTYLIPVLCNETQCQFRVPTRKDLDKCLHSFDLSIFLGFTSFVLFNGILSIIPLGGKKYASLVPRDGHFEYVLNALFALIIQVAILISLEVYHVPVTSHIIDNFLGLITSAVVLSLALGLILFVKSFYVRREKLVDEDQNYLNNFIMGAEINPRFGPMDVKFVVVRVCIVGLILLVLSYAYQSMEMISTPPMDVKSAAVTNWTLHLLQSIRIRPSLFVLCTLIVIYFADQFVFESCLMSTMEFKATSWGFLKCNEYLAGLFIYGAVPKYVYDYNVELQSWELLLCTVVFLAGYAMYRGANSQKHAFRENPYGPLVSRYESIPSTTGKKILCSGYWGFVRHPNYLGDIMLNAALVRFVWPTPLLLVFVFIICHLALRAHVDNNKCRQRYGVAWERYCQRVPYLLVPKVF